MNRVAGSLQALLSHLIDYAGLFPPASLPLAIAAERYRGFLASPERWILNRLVLPAPLLAAAPLEKGWRVALLAEEEPGPLPPQVESIETKGNAVFGLPAYREAAPESIAGAFAKVRTGGLTPEAIPSSADLAAFLCRAASRKLPFKATAGLHHPIRSRHPLSYAADSPVALMHGFLNVFTAAAFAWHGWGPERVAAVLEEQDPAAFAFGDEELHWRGHVLATAQVHAARREFAHSFGSCSFEEPVSDLRELGLLP